MLRDFPFSDAGYCQRRAGRGASNFLPEERVPGTGACLGFENLGPREARRCYSREQDPQTRGGERQIRLQWRPRRLSFCARAL